YFRAVTEGRRHRRGKMISISGDVPVGMRIDFEEFAKAVETEIWRKVAKVNWREFEEAREYVQSLNLKNNAEWRKHTKTSDFPKDIPADPAQTYRSKGWVSWGNWFGTGRIATQKRDYRSFERAREYVWSLSLKNAKEWQKHVKSSNLPKDIPATPESVYQNSGWISLGDWLGTMTVANHKKEFFSFEEARKYARSLGLKSGKEWFKRTKSLGFPKDDIPVTPNRVYREKGWINWGDWLGTGNVHSKEFRSFEEAREYVRYLNLQNGADWRRSTKAPDFPKDIPLAPDQTYRNKGWVSMGDWLGTGMVASRLRQYRPFEEAREYARSLNLQSSTEWRRHTKQSDFPKDIPHEPSQTYKGKGWVSFGDWLGTGTVATFQRKYRSFEEAREYVQSLNLQSSTEWHRRTKQSDFPEDIPHKPSQTYKGKGWVSFGDWLGTGIVATFQRKYRPFEEAREYARSLGLKNGDEWFRHTKSLGFPKDDVPVTPHHVYRGKGWINWGDYLGTGNVRSKEFRSFEEAREYVRSLKIKSWSQWFKYIKTSDFPKDIPTNPNSRYRDKGWVSWGDWLGTGTVAPHLRQYRPFEEAREYAHSLNLNKRKEWLKHAKLPDFPKDIPVTSDRVYKNKGWVSWSDFLGYKRRRKS
ncbi:MAG: hypothetical protein OXF52_05635, partial [Candidatus Dadabacteria bacterium]|nr:hypothetical protein [Candidatus Dadabacteria bacterium]